MADYFDPSNVVLPTILIMIAQCFIFWMILYLVDIRNRKVKVHVTSTEDEEKSAEGASSPADANVAAEIEKSKSERT